MNFHADKYEFTILCNVTPYGLDCKFANYGPLSHDTL